jgi:hypothetical protein
MEIPLYFSSSNPRVQSPRIPSFLPFAYPLILVLRSLDQPHFNLALVLRFPTSFHHELHFFYFWEGVAIFFIPRHVALWTIDYDSPFSIQIIPTTNICHGCIYNQSKLQLLTRHSSNLPSPRGPSIIQVKWSKSWKLYASINTGPRWYVFWVSPYPFLPHVSRFNQSTRQWASFLTHD